MGPNAERLLARVMRASADTELHAESRERLEIGSAQYGDWDSDRDWHDEARAEAIDGIHYCLIGAERASDGIERNRFERAASLFAAAWGLCQRR